jgi:hypothetical protein
MTVQELISCQDPETLWRLDLLDDGAVTGIVGLATYGNRQVVGVESVDFTVALENGVLFECVDGSFLHLELLAENNPIRHWTIGECMAEQARAVQEKHLELVELFRGNDADEEE